jgi:hypothetical protein
MNSSARIRRILTLLLLPSLLVPARASAADQTCDQGAAINASAAVSGYQDDLNLNLADYGIIFQDASQETNAAAWDSARDALIRKIDSTMAAGSHYNAVTNKTGGPYQGWLEGASVSLIMASGLLLADHGRLTRPLDSAIRRVIGSYVFNRDAGCGFSDGRWWGQNNCMDDYTIAATGYAWIAAYKYKRSDRDVSSYTDAAKNAISLSLGLEDSVCAYRTGSAWSPSSSRGPCTATVDDLRTGQAEVISLNHGQQTIAYGLGLMTSISSAFIGLQTANSAPVLTADQNDVALALFREGQSRTITGGDTFNPTGCYTFTPDRTAFQLGAHCGDVGGTYKPKMFPVKSFYTQVLGLTPPSTGFQFDVFDPTLFSGTGFLNRGRQVVYGDLTKCWYPAASRPALGGIPVTPPLADVVWVKPSYVTWGAPNTLTVAGYASNGSGGVQLRWRDVTTGGPEQVESYQPFPAASGGWSNTLPTASHCHDYEVYVNYAGSTSNTFLYSGLGSGYCPESARITWIQPGSGSPGSLVVLGSAANDPAGSAVTLYWRDLSVPSPTWNLVSFAAPVAADGAWYNTIPNVNYSHVYEVYARYDAFASRLCRYNGNQLPNWCEVNYAAPSAGAAVSASSTYSAGYPVSAVNNGDRKGLNWGGGGGWNDATANAYPDWVQVDFNGIKTIDQVNVFTLQDNIGNPVEPVEALTFSAYGLTNLGVDYWNDATGTWKPVPGAVVAGNNKVWTRFLFSPLATSKIRVTVTGALFSYSRITEVEAWGVPPAKSNYASAVQGATATASSTFSSGYPVAAVTDGDRKGLNWSAGGGWNDATANAYPDWVQVNFNGIKTIDQINVFTLQDNYGNPADPTQTMTFSAYGITAFEVQYLDGSTWVTVPGGSVTGNNNVWRSFSFSPVTTTGIRVLVNNALSSFSRITEIEALGW